MAGKVNRDELYVKLNAAIQLLVMFHKTHVYDTAAIVAVANVAEHIQDLTKKFPNMQSCKGLKGYIFRYRQKKLFDRKIV